MAGRFHARKGISEVWGNGWGTKGVRSAEKLAVTRSGHRGIMGRKSSLGKNSLVERAQIAEFPAPLWLFYLTCGTLTTPQDPRAPLNAPYTPRYPRLCTPSTCTVYGPRGNPVAMGLYGASRVPPVFMRVSWVVHSEMIGDPTGTRCPCGSPRAPRGARMSPETLC